MYNISKDITKALQYHVVCQGLARGVGSKIVSINLAPLCFQFDLLTHILHGNVIYNISNMCGIILSRSLSSSLLSFLLLFASVFPVREISAPARLSG